MPSGPDRDQSGKRPPDAGPGCPVPDSREKRPEGADGNDVLSDIISGLLSGLDLGVATGKDRETRRDAARVQAEIAELKKQKEALEDEGDRLENEHRNTIAKHDDCLTRESGRSPGPDQDKPEQ